MNVENRDRDKILEVIGDLGSSNVKEISYCKQLNELFVTFQNDATYIYYDVPAETWNEFKEAESKGRYVSTVIKKQFEYMKLEKNEE